ncbi:hypothetical protein CEXT_542191 [Caerostris extrusa]|uniref:Tudor domain-containing protein n=1 Tax=Caerostris extrusa TaxID=172846 RepID=A0AAV4RIR5_CAEEX|nr:hypothetical protein CEXT_542191 [Caerostris extrusa]
MVIWKKSCRRAILHMLNTYGYNFPPLDIEYVNEGDVCAYRHEVSNIWCRVKVMNVPENGIATIKFLDHGGYRNVAVRTLKRLHSNFLHLPFQAVECQLYDILPSEGHQWSEQCLQEVHRVVHLSNVLRVFVLRYNRDAPIVQVLYRPYFPQMILSKHLIALGLAKSMAFVSGLQGRGIPEQCDHCPPSLMI